MSMMRYAVGIIFALALMAQEPATIQGVLTDASGAAIPAATVSLSGANIKTAAQTAPDGTWSFNVLTAGDYTLKVDTPGLEPFERRVQAEAGKTLRVPIQLRLRI